MEQQHAADLEVRVARLERAFKYLPLALLAVFSVAAVVFIAVQ